VRGQSPQPDAREGQAGLSGVADGFVVPVKPGNAGGGKGPEFKEGARRGTRARGLATSLATPPMVQTSPGWRPAPVASPTRSACVLVREPGAGNPHAGFDGRGVETGHGWDNEAPATERAGNG
jgi:hypothetical protein